MADEKQTNNKMMQQQDEKVLAVECGGGDDGTFLASNMHNIPLSSTQPESGCQGVGNAGKEDEDDDDDDDAVEPENLQYKIIVLGNGAVGKTSMIMRFCEDFFDKKYKQTIGLDFFIKKFTLPGNKRVTLQLWDIGGQTIGSKMIGNYLHGSDAIFFAYDVTNYQSFQDVEEWLQLVLDHIDPAHLPYMALVGNKTDLIHLCAVKKDKHEDFVKTHNLHSFFASAKTADGVQPMFTRAAADLASVALSKAELDATTQVVKATIVAYPQHDPHQPPLVIEPQKSRCSIM